MKFNRFLFFFGLITVFISCQPKSAPPAPPVDKPDSGHSFRQILISVTDTDYHQLEFDTTNRLVRFTRQNLYVQGTDQVYRVVCEPIYTGKRITRMNVAHGSATSYFVYSYQGDNVNQTQEFSAAGLLIGTQRYTYYADNRLRCIHETYAYSQSLEKTKTFMYDANGNLAQVVEARKMAPSDGINVEYVTRYTDYDSHKNVTNAWQLYPLIPQVTLLVNNPGTIALYAVGPDGAETLSNRSSITYQYNAKGYPINHTENRGTFTMSATYTYTDQ